MAKDKSEKKEKRSKSKPETEEANASMIDEDILMADVESESPKKSKKEKDEVVVNPEDLSPIAQPLAQKKLLKKLHKTIKRASKQRHVRRGVKEVVKSIRKGEKGLLVLAADITPMDIISHLPVLSEEAQVPYIFVSSKEELGHAASTKRPTSCVMICPNAKVTKKVSDSNKEVEDYKEIYDECYKEVEKINAKILF